MPARTVVFIPEGCYHVYNRGSEKRSIFQSERDYNKFLHRSRENAQKFSITILCYCLMPNHFHFLLQQTSEASIISFMNALQLGHAKFFNTKYERVGPLYQGRFKAKPITSDEYLLQLSAYIHRNPITSLTDFGNPLDSRNILELLRSYPYSSYQEYLALETKKPLSKPEMILAYFSKTQTKFSYQAFVENFVPDLEALAPLLAHVWPSATTWYILIAWFPVSKLERDHFWPIDSRNRAWKNADYNFKLLRYSRKSPFRSLCWSANSTTVLRYSSLLPVS